MKIIIGIFLILPFFSYALTIGPELISDNTTATTFTLTGNWSIENSETGFFGADYAQCISDEGQKEAMWQINLTEAGRYNVSIYHPANQTYSKAALYQIYHKKGITDKKVDLRFNGGKWIPLGLFDFDKGDVKIAISTKGSESGSIIVADAVKLQRYSPQPTADIIFNSFPKGIFLNKSFDVSIQVDSNLSDCGLRGVFAIEMRDTSDTKIIQTVFDDNRRKGFNDKSFSKTYSFTLTKKKPSVYFVAYLSPYGFNDHIINEFESTPIDGTFPYKWVGNGVTHDIYYQSSLILANNSENYCYCSGITYESFMDAWNKYLTNFGKNDIFGITVSQMKNFRSRWYGVVNRDCSTDALTYYNCGVRINNLEEVQPGDFVQLWREGGSGHSVIFLDFERDTTGIIQKICYWSTQTATNGCGYNKETWSNMTSETSFARAAKPFDTDDWEKRYSDKDTAITPTYLIDSQTIVEIILGRKECNEIEFMAMDINSDNKVDIADLILSIKN